MPDNRQFAWLSKCRQMEIQQWLKFNTKIRLRIWHHFFKKTHFRISNKKMFIWIQINVNQLAKQRTSDKFKFLFSFSELIAIEWECVRVFFSLLLSRLSTHRERNGSVLPNMQYVIVLFFFELIFYWLVMTAMTFDFLYSCADRL